MSNILMITEGPFLKKITVYSIPILLSEILQMLFNTADKLIAGKFIGGEALATISSTTSILNIMIYSFIGLSSGGSVLIGINIGSRNFARIHNLIYTSFVLSLIFGFLIAIFGYFLSPLFIKILACPEEIKKNAITYLRLNFIGAPALLIFNFSTAILRASGIVFQPLIILTIGIIMNFVLNLIFLIVFHMNIIGVGFASIVSQYSLAIFIIVYIMKYSTLLQLKIKNSNFFKRESMNILRLGLPSGLQNSLLSVSGIVIQSTVNSFGIKTIAGFAIAHILADFVSVVCNSVSQTVMYLFSQNLGAKKYDTIKKIYWLSFKIVLIISILLSLIILTFSNSIISLLIHDLEIISTGVYRLKLLMPIYFIFCLQDLNMYSLMGLKKTFASMILSLIGNCFLRIAWVLIVFPQYPTVQILLIMYPISWIITFFFTFSMVKYNISLFINSIKAQV